MAKKDKKLDNNKAAVGKKFQAKANKSQPKKEKKEITEVKARARFVRVAPRKTRLVTSQVVNLPVEKALNYLRFYNKAAVRPVVKLINSAIANAQNNYSLDRKDLYIKKIITNDGPFLKRWRPRAHGRATMIRKKTSHIDLILGVKAGAQKGKKVVKDIKEIKEEIKVIRPEEIKKEAPKFRGKGPEEKGKSSKGFFKGMFQRKTG